MDHSLTLSLSIALQVGSLAVLSFVIKLGRQVDRRLWEHDLMWKDYRKLHGMNGDSGPKTHTAHAGA